MRIAILGANGQLAYDLRQRLADQDVTALPREEVDLCQVESICRRLDGEEFDVVINTAAYNLVDKAESEPLAAFEVNYVGTWNIANYCANRGWRLAHFSTDYVFGLESDRSTPWSEDDAPGPVSVYGTSKLAGEYAVRSTVERHLVLRTCGLYGIRGSRGKGGNFVETMLRLADSGKPLRIVSDQYCTPSHTADVADACARLIETDAQGVVHVTNSGQATWHAFACEIFRQAGKEVDCQPITSEEFGAAAQRPPYSVLSLERLQSATNWEPRSWQDALSDYLSRRAARVAAQPA